MSCVLVYTCGRGSLFRHKFPSLYFMRREIMWMRCFQVTSVQVVLWGTLCKLCCEVPCASCAVRYLAQAVLWGTLRRLCCEVPCAGCAVSYLAQVVLWGTLCKLCCEVPCASCAVRYLVVVVQLSVVIFGCLRVLLTGCKFDELSPTQNL